MSYLLLAAPDCRLAIRATAQILAGYWADGQRTILEIIDRIEMEIGIRDAELMVREFELLERLGLVKLERKS